MTRASQPSEPDTIDRVLALEPGKRFRLSGRKYTKAHPSAGCVSHYAGYSLVPVWNYSGKLVTIKVRPDSKLNLVPWMR